jgi:hypothetical protein
MMRRNRVRTTVIAAALLAPASAGLALPAFPGAEGFGGAFTGAVPAGGWFANATVYHVTNLNDSGPGSLRGAFVENSANKIIVFDVAGTINLTTDNLDIKNLSNYYIAGQTAPGPVTVYGDMVQLTHSSGKTNSNVILRYMSFRKGTGDNSDSITFAGSGLGTNLILDHVSASWSEDEILSVANNNTNVTVQYSMIHDALVNNHAYGSLIRPRINSNVTFHHNLYANNASRQARFGTYESSLLTTDFINNVVYNWRDRASYAGGSSEAEQEFVDVNFIGNHFIAGPGTVANLNKSFIVDKNVDVRAYQSGNFMDSDKSLNPAGQPNGADLGWSQFAFNTIIDQTLTQMNSAFANPSVTTQSANDAYWQVINHVGNFWWARDTIDSRVINNVLTNTAPAIGGAAPLASELNALLTAPTLTRAADWDTDGDGMPGFWEIAHGLNPSSNLDFKLDFDNDGYINLVEYLNEAGAFPSPALNIFNNSEGNNRYARNDNWSTWQPSRFDTVKINSGHAIVDAVGQHAGQLHVGFDLGSNGSLVMSSGWLDVAGSARIGSGTGSSGALLLNGGVLRVSHVLHVGKTGSVHFDGGAVDIKSGAAIFDEAAGEEDLLAEVVQQVASGRNGGAWNGAGIRSSTVATDPTHLGIGVVRNGDLASPFATFAGETVDADSILLAITFLGDANLDAKVDVADLGILASNWQTAGTWGDADFDYNGSIDVNDLGMLASNWQAGVPLSSALAAMGLPEVSVPEPATAGAILVAKLSWLCQRRRIAR